MCDKIDMPDGSIIESISENGDCLCCNTQKEILKWIIDNIPDLQISESISIERDPFGYNVRIYQSRTHKTPHQEAALKKSQPTCKRTDLTSRLESGSMTKNADE